MKRLLILFLFISTPAIASERAMISSSIITGKSCEMTETVSVSMSFNEQEIDLANARGMMDDKLGTVQEIATGLGIENLELQSYSYNIYANNNGGCSTSSSARNYQLNGNLSFMLKSADKSDELMKALSEKGFYVNFNLNAYRQCQ